MAYLKKSDQIDSPAALPRRVDVLQPRHDRDFRLRRVRHVRRNVQGQRHVDGGVRGNVPHESRINFSNNFGVMVEPVVVPRTAELLPVGRVHVHGRVDGIGNRNFEINFVSSSW